MAYRLHSLVPRLPLACALLACGAVFGQEGKNPPRGKGVPASLEATVDRAARILIALQEDLDGGESPYEWPYEGVYRENARIPIGYRVGGTSICAWSLIETPIYSTDSELREAVGRSLDFVLRKLGHDRMSADFNGRYDVRGWGHTYALTFLLRLRARGLVPSGHEDEVGAKIAQLVHTLEETEIPRVGGWAYARGGGRYEPSPASPFMTAPTLIALYEAAAQGEAVDNEVVQRALDSLEGSRTKQGNIPYSTDGGRDKTPGAIGRTPAAEVALHLAGRSSVDRLRSSLDAFLEDWEWLEKRRRQTGTHAPPYGIAPYYFFYAHYYAALAIEFLDEEERPGYRARFLERLFQVQEESGGWNDRVFPRSENYGTAMALLAVLQPRLPRPSAWNPPPKEGRKK